MLRLGVDPQSFPSAPENRRHTDRYGHKTAVDRLFNAIQPPAQTPDERILGDGDFVEAVLSGAQEAYERKYRLKASGIDVENLAHDVAEILGIEPVNVWDSGKHPQVVQARSLLCYWATSELGISQARLSRRLGLSQPAVSLSVTRGRAIAAKYNYKLRLL
jgi:putative transposase